ncbi:MAG: hypothetical protein J3K34DRAFT_444687 [Monoraphidium minutum]|nr:MAG: hypothetical protein J3K34DRAFT_444687 [Monoraphidium minutum]
MTPMLAACLWCPATWCSARPPARRQAPPAAATRRPALGLQGRDRSRTDLIRKRRSLARSLPCAGRRAHRAASRTAARARAPCARRSQTVLNYSSSVIQDPGSHKTLWGPFQCRPLRCNAAACSRTAAARRRSHSLKNRAPATSRLPPNFLAMRAAAPPTAACSAVSPSGTPWGIKRDMEGLPH